MYAYPGRPNSQWKHIVENNTFDLFEWFLL